MCEESECKNSREAEGRPKGAVERWKKDMDAQMNRGDIHEPSQMLRTEHSIISVSKGIMIIHFSSSTLQRDFHIVEEFFNCERRINNNPRQRSTTEEKRETETDSVN